MIKSAIRKTAVFIFIFAAPALVFGQDGLRHEAKTFKVEGFSKTGQKEWLLEGEWAEMLSDRILFSNIKAEGNYNDTVITLKADKGIYNKKEGDVLLEGNVEAATSDGGYMSTEKAVWNMEGQRFTSDVFVKVIKNDIVSTGTGVTAHAKLKEASFQRDVRVEVPPSTVVTCDGPFEIYYNEQRAVFRNNVKIKDERGDMSADELTAFFDPETHEIERVIVKGGVKMIKQRDDKGDFFDAPFGGQGPR